MSQYAIPNMQLIRSFVYLIALTLLSSHIQIQGAFSLLELPNTWTFQEPTPAFNDPEKSKTLGDFQPNIRVRVLDQLLDKNLWHVEYASNTSKPIQAYIDPPTSALPKNPRHVQKLSADLADFPLLDALLKARDPWSLSAKHLERSYFNPLTNVDISQQQAPFKFVENQFFINHSAEQLKSISLWGWKPKELYIDYRNQKRITINLWNRGDSQEAWKDAYKKLTVLKNRLKSLEDCFGNTTARFSMEKKIFQSEITALRQTIDYFFLANDIMIQLRWSRNEFISIDLLSYSEQTSPISSESNSHSLASTLKQSVIESPDGYLFINSIPMISQGDKGYCAPASLARILQYYGYPVSMHSLSELAETSATQGTHMDEIFSSVQRICNSTPFKIKVLDNPRRKELVAYIEKGIPFFWLIPGHARLINGIHPDGGIVYTDSWGQEHAFKFMSWSQFKNLNQTLFVLEIQ